MNICADIALCKIIDKKLCILVTQRSKAPFLGKRCLPWWFLKNDESIEETVIRVLKKETWIHKSHLEQIKVFSSPDRDPRWRSIWVAFLGVITEHVDIVVWASQDKVMRAPIQSIPHLVFDHSMIVQDLYKTLVEGIEIWKYAPLFLEKEFTLRQLQDVYEAILHRTYEKRNFKKYILNRYKLKKTKMLVYGNAYRPSRLYTI